MQKNSLCIVIHEDKWSSVIAAIGNGWTELVLQGYFFCLGLEPTIPTAPIVLLQLQPCPLLLSHRPTELAKLVTALLVSIHDRLTQRGAERNQPEIRDPYAAAELSTKHSMLQNIHSIGMYLAGKHTIYLGKGGATNTED